jgi:UDP-glucose:tetrahydrobiopterin glucosyltransferase
VPVVAYRRGGPAEMIEEGRTGWLVEPDSVDGLIDAVHRLDKLDRAACRRQAERDFSLEALGQRWEQWFNRILAMESTAQSAGRA